MPENKKAKCKSDSDKKHRRRRQSTSSSDSFTTIEECKRRSPSPRPRRRSPSPKCRRRSPSPKCRRRSPSPRRRSPSPRCRRSSSSSSSSDSEELVLLNKKINHLDNKLHKNKHNDDYVEDKLEKLETKLCKNTRLDRKWRLKYRTVVERLRREKCLMVNGSDAYGSFYSTAPQSITPNSSAIFDHGMNVLNLQFTPGTSDIKILRSGMYTLHITAQFDQPCQVAFFVGNTPDLTTVTASNSGAHIVTVHQILRLNANDIVSFRNYISTITITTSLPASGLITDSQNIDFTLWRIAPLPEACCALPELNCKAWCDFESDSDSDNECPKKNSKKCSKKNSKKCSKKNSKKCSKKDSKKDSKKCKKDSKKK